MHVHCLPVQYDIVFGFWEYNMHLILDSIYPKNMIKINLMWTYLRMNDMMYSTYTYISVWKSLCQSADLKKKKTIFDA
jgi:hypothetical protein